MLNVHFENTPANVLLVEDDEIDAKWVLRALRGKPDSRDMFSVNIEHVARLDSAIERLGANNIQLVLLDLGLPDSRTDFDSVERIHEKSPDIPIIVYSGSSYESAGLVALDKGALYYFPKASDDEERLNRTVQQALVRHHLQSNLRSIIDSTPDGVVIVDPSGQMVFANSTAASLLNLSPDAASLTFPFPLDLQRVREVSLSNERVAELRVTTFDWNGKHAFMATLHETTERANLERQLRQAQKMEAVGLLASGVAHDFNNILTVITGYTDMLLERLPPHSDFTTELREILGASERATALTRRLLTFSREDRSAPREINLDKVVKEVHSLLRRLIGEDIDLVLDCDTAEYSIHADPTQLEQVIFNLAVNARDAMPDGGALTIETSVMQLSEEYISNLLWIPEPGEYLMLAVTDTGCGMTEDVLSHVFEPFFTTKAANQGTGLGLATVYGIVQQNRGSIWVYSEPGIGTTFKLYFPTTTATHGHKPADGESREIVRGTETILLVEDEDAVRRFAGQVLKARGYQVIEAQTPPVALSLFHSRRSEIDLLLTDIIMPGMNGRELSEQILEMEPDLKVLYMSGYTSDTVIQRGILDGGMLLLQKPFTPTSLALHVRQVLDDGKEQRN